MTAISLVPPPISTTIEEADEVIKLAADKNLKFTVGYSQRFKPKFIIDVATMTGACVVALRAHHSGLMSNSDVLADKIINAGIAPGDATWRLPLTEDYASQIVSNFADVANISTRGSGAGTITAGCFLEKFVGDFDWAHIDIAGVAWLEGANKGATGRPVALVSEFLISESSN